MMMVERLIIQVGVWAVLLSIGLLFNVSAISLAAIIALSLVVDIYTIRIVEQILIAQYLASVEKNKEDFTNFTNEIVNFLDNIEKDNNDPERKESEEIE